MSVHMSIGDCSFFLPAESRKAALAAALLALDWDEKIKKGHCPRQPRTLERALAAEDWSVETNKSGDIVNILFMGEKMGDSLELFEAIAPWVQAGSYLCVILDNDPVRWFFDGKALIEQGVTYV